MLKKKFAIWETTFKGIHYAMHSLCIFEIIIIKASFNLIALKLVKIKVTTITVYEVVRKFQIHESLRNI